MMSKKALIEHINHNYHGSLNNSNTSFSNINKSKEVWWFNIPVSKFIDDVHLLLNTPNQVIWIRFPKGFSNNMVGPFKIREDKNAVDLEISADPSYMYLKDVKSGGTGFDFEPFVVEKVSKE